MKEANERFISNAVYIPERGVLRIEIPYTDYQTLLKRGYSKAEVTLIDDRPLSDKQRKACYSMMNEIADWMGEERSETKELMKLEFATTELLETGNALFSLATASMSLIAQFQRFLVRFIVSHDVPTKKSMLDYVEDTSDYVYSCLVNKKCVCCGKRSDLHHLTAVGMGRDRTEIVHEGMKVLPLCREHHTEFHTIGKEKFMYRYHLDDGIELDRTLCRIYGLKTKKGKKNE